MGSMGSGSSSELVAEVAAARSDPRRRFGRWVLLSQLGSGGMGTVFRAWDEQLARVVAIKVLQATRFRQEKALARFHREARAAARLDHAGIISIHDVSEIADQPFIAMDFVAGETLGAAIRRGIARDELLRVVSDVARALQHAHERGIVHRDVKPENVLIASEDRRVVLTDFGIARDETADEQLTATGEVVGTLNYMAPEQVRGERGSIGPATDVHALGAVLYRALSGRTPYPGERSVEVMAAILGGRVEAPRSIDASIPSDLEALVLRCLAPDPAQRPASAAALADALDAIRAGRSSLPSDSPSGSSSSSRVRAPRRGSRPSGRSSQRIPAPRSASRPGVDPRVIVGAVIGLLVVGALAFVLGRGGEDSPPDLALADSAVESGAESDSDTTAADSDASSAPPSRPADAADAADAPSPPSPPEAEPAGAVDRTPPVLELDAPADGAVLSSRSFSVRGRVVDGAGSARLGGEALSLDADGRFETTLTLDADGPVVIALDADDASGNSAETLRRRVVVDSVAPSVVVTSPVDGVVVDTPDLTVAGRVADAHPPTSVRVGDREVPLSADGSFTLALTLAAEGSHSIAVEAIDAAGNAQTATLTVTFDSGVPTIVLDPPLPPELFGRTARKIVVAGRVDRAGSSVTVAGEAARLDGLSFSRELRLDEGANEIEVVAVDPAGKEARVELSVAWYRKRPKGHVPAGTWWTPTPGQIEAISTRDALPLWFEGPLGLRFVIVPPGPFAMGPDGDRVVILSRPVWIASTEVTNAQMRAFRADYESKRWLGRAMNGDDQPAIDVAHADAVAFGDWLGAQAGTPGLYRLPTEAEWERAARAGTTTRFFWGDDPAEHARFANVLDTTTKKKRGFTRPAFPSADPFQGTAPVASFEPNPWGLYDVIGNAHEWCGDLSAGRLRPTTEPLVDPTGPEKGKGHVVRGDHWWGDSNSDGCFDRSSNSDSKGRAGFRIVAVSPPSDR